MRAEKGRRAVDGTGLLKLYDRATGVFNEIFDSRLLTPAVFALLFYCTLFTQRKFPMRWMVFVLFGMILLLFVTLTARVPGRARVRFHGGMAALWFSLHAMMVVSGLFYQDWLPESVPLLLVYPMVFSVFSSRGDESTFRAVLRGAVFAVLPFVVWSYAAVPVTLGYPGFKGVFYDANCMSMALIVMTAAALVLAYAAFSGGRRGVCAFYTAVALLGAATLALTLSRSGLLALAGVLVILTLTLIAGTAKRPARLIAALLAALAVFGAGFAYITLDKMHKAAEEDYALAVHNFEEYGQPITVPKPEERELTMDDLTSDRWGIWTTILENLTWNGHETSIVREWVARDGAGERLFNAHNAFLGVAYNNGFIAGALLVAYTLLALWRALRYYWLNRRASAYAATPLAFTAVFILVGMFESVYAPFSVIGCAFLLVQAPLWRAELTMAREEDAP